MIVKLDCRNEDSEKLGNKGRFLQMMKNEGFNVPSGFILDCDVYDEVIKLNNIDVKIKEALVELNKDNIKDVSEETRSTG